MEEFCRHIIFYLDRPQHPVGPLAAFGDNKISISYKWLGALPSYWHNKQQSKVHLDQCKIPTDGIVISSNQPILGIPGQTKLMQI